MAQGIDRRRTGAAYRIFVVTAVVICSLARSSPLDAKPAGACATLSRLLDAPPEGPVFLPSYPTAKIAALKGTAFLYDNAVAAIALVGCGEREKALRIGDAVLAALNHDRYWHDGRLRNAYVAGPLGAGDVKLPGWWDGRQNKWMEDAYQVGSDSGNMAWAVLALLALDRPGGDRRYRDAAVRIATWITRWQNSRGEGGFAGGTFDEEPRPRIRAWKSTEQNSDLAAAFRGLAGAFGGPKWIRSARAAQQFVRAMWDPRCRCFDAGTVEDGITRNRFFALDAQLFPLLALPGASARYETAVATAGTRLRYGQGFAYGEARAGMWTEGTEQAALLLELSGRTNEARNLIKAADTMRAPGGGYFAVSVPALPTGLRLDTDPSQSRQYFHLAHLAPLSWAALVERQYNPFTRQHALP